MVTNFFWIGYHFEEFRSQVAIWKKKSISHPVYQNKLNGEDPLLTRQA